MEALRGRRVVAGCARVNIRRSEGGHLTASKVIVTTLVYEAIWTWIIAWRRRWTHGREAIGHVLSVRTIGLMRAMTSSSMLRRLLVWVRRDVASRWGRCRRGIVRVGISTKHHASSGGMGVMHRRLAVERLRRRVLGRIRTHAVELAMVRRDEGWRHLVSRSRG
jgi:hypothetical protein